MYTGTHTHANSELYILIFNLFSMTCKISIESLSCHKCMSTTKKPFLLTGKTKKSTQYNYKQFKNTDNVIFYEQDGRRELNSHLWGVNRIPVTSKSSEEKKKPLVNSMKCRYTFWYLSARYIAGGKMDTWRSFSFHWLYFSDSFLSFLFFPFPLFKLNYRIMRLSQSPNERNGK